MRVLWATSARTAWIWINDQTRTVPGYPDHLVGIRPFVLVERPTLANVLFVSTKYLLMNETNITTSATEKNLGVQRVSIP